MRREPVDKHQKMAIAGFIITLVVAIIAFYYVWQMGVNYGKTIEGARALASIWEKRKALQEQRPAEIPDKFLAMRPPCCVYMQHPKRASSLKVDVPRHSESCAADPLVEFLVRKKGFVITDIEDRECPKQKA